MHLLTLLSNYKQEHLSEEEQILVERIQDFLKTAAQPFHREHLAGHVTGSALIVNPERTHVLLTHHKKFDKWMQLGGHSDGDEDTLRVAHREGYEESGLLPEAIIPVSKNIFDIDVHVTPERGEEPEHFHYDIRFLFEADDKIPLVISEESHDLAWKDVQELLEDTSLEASIRRMIEKITVKNS